MIAKESLAAACAPGSNDQRLERCHPKEEDHSDGVDRDYTPRHASSISQELVEMAGADT